MTSEWASRFRQAVLDLKLNPSQFWELSFKEWLALITPLAAPVLARDDLNALMSLFPDNKK